MKSPDRATLTAKLNREVRVPAHPATVWRFLSTGEGWAAWWGAGSTIDARPGGLVHIAYPNQMTADGMVLELEPERRLVFSFGYDRDDTPLEAGSSIVEIQLDDLGDATRVRLVHLLPNEAVRDHHVAGWRYQLGLFASVVVRAALAPGLESRVDSWHAAWGIVDATERRRRLEEILTPSVSVIEPMAQMSGIDDLDAWIAQVQQQMPATVARSGPVALSGGTAAWDWTIAAGGVPLATGRSAAVLDADGRIARVTAFWLTGPPGIPTSVV